MAFQVQKVFGTFDKQAPGARFSDQNLYSKKKTKKTNRIPHRLYITTYSLIHYDSEVSSNLRLASSILSPQQRMHKVVVYFQVLEV